MLDHKYKVFYHLAQTPNTTKVAEELLLSQPAISKNIKELEKELGITLFNRIKGRMQLTEAGQYLYSEIEGEFYQFNLSSCIRQQNSLTAQFVSFSLSNLANIFYPPQFLQ